MLEKLGKPKLLEKLDRLKRSSMVMVAFITVVYTIVDVLIVILSVPPSSGGTAALQYSWVSHLGEILFHSLVILGLGTIAVFILESWQSVRTVDDSVKGVDESTKTLIDRAGQLEESIIQMKKNRHSFESREMGQFIRDHHGETIGELLRKWHEELEDALTLSLNHRRFTVENEMQALRSYQIFWELLVAEQRKEKEGDKGLNVLIVHSSSLKIWSDYAIGKLILGSQRQFHGNGGKATRILCGPGKPDSNFMKVAKEMKEHGIEVFYHDIETSKTGFNFGWDFLYVKETKAAVIWESFGPGASIKTSTYQIGSRFKGYELEELWNIIWTDSKPIDDYLKQSPEN